MAVGLSQTDSGYKLGNKVYIGSLSSVNVSLVASRGSGSTIISPATVHFDCTATTAPAYDNHQICRQFGYSYNFGDSGSGTYSTPQGGSRNTYVGGPITSHTFIVADGAGPTVFTVKVNVEGPNGETGSKSVNITVTDPLSHFAAADTYCISTSLNPLTESQWTDVLFDRPCPASANYANDFSDIAHNNLDGKLILLKRGENFTGLTPAGGSAGVIRVQYGESNFHVSTFGNDADARPVLNGIVCGVSSAGGSSDYTAANFASWGGFSENITFESLKVLDDFTINRTHKHPQYFDLDLDTTSEPTSCNWIVNQPNTNDNPSIQPNDTDYTYPWGYYFDRIVARASSTDDSNTNVGAFFTGDMPICKIAILECTIGRAVEHNLRLMSTQRASIHHNSLEGNHTALSQKHRLAFRAKGYNKTLITESSTMNSTGQSGTVPSGRDEIPYTRYAVIEYNRGSSGTLWTDDNMLKFQGTRTGTMANGGAVTGDDSGATGTLVGPGSSGAIIIKVLTGTFQAEEIRLDSDPTNQHFNASNTGTRANVHSRIDFQTGIDQNDLSLEQDVITRFNNSIVAGVDSTSGGNRYQMTGQWMTNQQNQIDGVDATTGPGGDTTGFTYHDTIEDFGPYYNDFGNGNAIAVADMPVPTPPS